MQLGIGKRIKKRRTDLGLTQEELAKRMGYKSKAAICKVEKGEDNITSDRVSKFANALECSPAYLMGWEEQIKVLSEELSEQTKPISDFIKTHTIDYNHLFNELAKRYGKEDVERAFTFTRAFLKATPERQKIALEILQGQSNQGDS